ncbi:serine/threonine-protein kinase [Streptomyces sp. NPDC004610]|uniref:serine/threonine-protein kinase n=1 Tax=Streptomyces sp. NPDC004610 TaxID=3154668 RepID=UPI0033A4BFDE
MSLVGGRYRLVERIGSGGMGTVWRAYDELVGREVAVKQPRLPGDPEDPAHQRAAHRLHREARAAARVDHPSAVTIHDVVVEDGLPWIVMELIRGESLHERLRRGTLPPAVCARIGLAVLGALRAAHSVGIVHRDVKPANVLLGPHDRVVLTDFGIAHVQGEESLTVSGEFVGSLEFIAPERMSGRGAGPASDLWSLGVLLYAAVEGGSPFRRTTLESTLAAILSADPPEPEHAGGLGPLLAGLLRKNPDERPGPAETAAVLRGVVGEGAAGELGEFGELGELGESGELGELGEFGELGELGESGELVESGESGESVEAQRPEGLREFGDDRGTVRLGEAAAAEGVAVVAGEEAAAGEGEAAAAAEPQPVEPTAPVEPTGPVEPAAPAEPGDPASAPPEDRIPLPAPPPRRRPAHRHPLALALVGALLVGGVGAGVALIDGQGAGAEGAEASRTPGASQAAESVGGSPSVSASATAWVPYEEPEMAAVLVLPAEYRELARQGGPEDQPRLVVYSAGSVDVRLTQWDRAPKDAMGRAEEAHEVWAGYDAEARTQYTRTSFQGAEAVIADTTYTSEGITARVMQLIILPGDGRLYELRVDMPKGTPDERRGTAVFKGVRDRLELTS